MDTRVAGAGVAMALGMMVLLPTFNALNNSYVENVQPPPWMPLPEELPEDFVPPPDFKPPEGWEPPPDWVPPEGWEPPPGYEGPIPPGGCPPPVIQHIPLLNANGTFDATWNGRSWDFLDPKYTGGIVVNVTFLDWQAREVSAEFTPPGQDTQRNATSAPGPTGLLAPPAQPVRETPFTFQMVAEDEASLPPQESYNLQLSADTPIQGRYTTEVVVGILCGGLLE